MNSSSDAAEQVVRLSLEGMEVAAKITGAGAKNLAVLMAAVLKEEQKTKGKARLSTLIKSGKDLTVFTVPQKDIEEFTRQAKKYGVLYCVMKEKNAKDPMAPIDIIAKAEDGARISRVLEKCKVAATEVAAVTDAAKEYVSPFAEEKGTEPPSGKESGKMPERIKTSSDEKMPMGKDASRRVSVKETLAGYRAEQKRKESLEKTKARDMYTPSRGNIRKPGPPEVRHGGRGAR